MLSVICFYWLDGQRSMPPASREPFTANDVKLWDRMVAKNLKMPHRRICVTHRPDLIDFMETAPLAMDKHVPGTCLVKLMQWKHDIGARLGNRILALDLDIIITGSLDEVIPDEGTPVKFYRNPNYEEGGRRAFYQGSVQYHQAGVLPEIWDDFTPEKRSWLNRRFGGAEQAWITERTNTQYPDAGNEWVYPYWTEKDGFYGAGRLSASNVNRESKQLAETGKLPENAKIVVFPGMRNPYREDTQKRYPWIKGYLV